MDNECSVNYLNAHISILLPLNATDDGYYYLGSTRLPFNCEAFTIVHIVDNGLPLERLEIGLLCLDEG